MLLCLDVGNSHIFAGVFADETLLLRFRHDTRQSFTSDQLGIFLRNVLRENDLDPHAVEHIAISSVVPNLDYTLASACQKYFSCNAFMLQAGVKTGLDIKYRNPSEVGADRIANAIAATHRYPGENLIIVDFGTATTFCVVNHQRHYLGGVITAGIRLAMDALQSQTAKLSQVRIVKPRSVLGRSTVESLQAGLYFSQLASISQISQQLATTAFAGKPYSVLGTGGFAQLFEDANIFDAILPDMVLQGLRFAYLLNHTL